MSDTPPAPLSPSPIVKQEHEGSPRKVGFDDSKDQQLFASLEVLRKAAWDSYDKRREFEWRIALALWAGMGAFGALTVAKDSLLRGPNVVLFASAMALALLGLHVSFLRELTRRNRFDSHTSYEYEAEMRKLIHWSFLDKTLDEERELVKKQHRSIMTNYSPRFQVSVTFLLGVIIVGALLWKSMQIDPIR